MKTISFLLASVCFTIIFSFSGCSDDSSPTYATAPPNTDSVMYKFDSMVVYSDDAVPTKAYYIYLDTCKITKFRIDCSFTSNDTTSPNGTIHSEAITSLTNNDTGAIFYDIRLGTNTNSYRINQVVTLNLSTPFRLVGAVYLSFLNYPNGLHKCIKAKDFKLYKVN